MTQTVPLTFKEKIPVLHLKGSPYQIGCQYGSLLKKDIQFYIKQSEEILIKKSRDFHQLLPLVVPLFIWIGRFFLGRNISSEYLEEMKGLADGAQVPLKNVILSNIYYDLMRVIGCSSFCASSSGKLIVGRNLDYDNLGFLDRYSFLTFYHPINGYSYASSYFIGGLGVLSGMNEKGLVITLNESTSDDYSLFGTPITLLLKKCLQYAGSCDEALDILKKSHFTSGFNLLVADPKKAVVYECSPKIQAVRQSENGLLFATNHFINPSLSKLQPKTPFITTNSTYRYQRLSDLLKEEPLSVEKAMAILRDTWDKSAQKESAYHNVIGMVINLQSMVFVPEDLTFWVAFGESPAVFSPYIGFHLLDSQREIPSYPASDFKESAYFKAYLLLKKAVKNIKCRETAQALADIEEAIKLDEHDAYFYFIQSLAYLQANETEKGQTALEIVFALKTDDYLKGKALFLAGLFLDLLGDREQAKNKYKAALTLHLPEIFETSINLKLKNPFCHKDRTDKFFSTMLS